MSMIISEIFRGKEGAFVSQSMVVVMERGRCSSVIDLGDERLASPYADHVTVLVLEVRITRTGEASTVTTKLSIANVLSIIN